MELTLEEKTEMEKEAWESAMQEDWELRHFGEFDWDHYVDRYDGTR